jgi:hypothetical protein
VSPSLRIRYADGVPHSGLDDPKSENYSANLDSDKYSAVESYLQQAESHEQRALSHCTSDSKEAIRKRIKKAKKYIKETSKKLPK